MRASILIQALRDETGAAAVEAVIVTPVLLSLAFGTIAFSNLFWDHQQISTGVRDAARYLARVQDPNVVAAWDRAKNIAVYGDAGGTMPARVAGFTLDQVANPDVESFDNSGDTYRGPDTLYIVTVTATVDYQDFSPFGGMLTALGLTPPIFAISHSERWIGE